MDLDLDYSQTHLDDFLKSQTNSSMMKGTNVQSGQLLTSFLSTYNKARSGTGSSLTGTGTGVDQSAALVAKAKDQNMNPIEEKEGDQESHTTEKKDAESDSDEDLGRTNEVIELDHVSVKSKPSEKQQKAILSPEDVSKIKAQAAADEQAEKAALAKKLKEQEEQQSIKLNMRTQQGLKEAIRFQMRVFDYHYDFKADELKGLEDDYVDVPTLEELYYYCKYVIISGRMEKEIPILCLIYLERFFTKTGILMTGSNWKRLTLISLILASKIWDDDSLENVHFPQVMSDVTLKEIAGIEAVFLQMIDFDLVIRGAEYAKYYFILKTFAEKFNSTLPMGPLSVGEMANLQNNTVKAESDLREKYNVKLSLKKTM